MSRRVPALAVLLLAFVMTPGARADAPGLLVVLVVDQMRADYIDAYGEHWTGGLRRLFDDGAWFRQAAYPYRSTVTCAGHATIATGALPAGHGMIQNSWWNRETGTRVTCTTDDRASAIGYRGPARERHSPATLQLPTVADILRLQAPHPPRVVSLSLKPRSAVTMAGQRGDAVVWFDAAGTFATSSAYAAGPVPEVLRYIEAHPVEDQLGQVWTRRLAKADYRHPDVSTDERPPGDWSSSFPHPLGSGSGGTPPAHRGDRADTDFYERWRSSPFSDAYLAQMAVALVDAYELGRGQRTDYLAIGFSALDLVGHQFGPKSHEVQDVLARLDDTLGTLLAALDERVGPDGYVVALSADHGVSPIPEQAAASGLRAGRIPTQEILRQAETLLAEILGPGPHIAALQGGDVYFGPGVWDELRARPRDLESIIALFASAPGVLRVYQADALMHHAHDDDTLARAVALSYFPGRSGDLVMVERPYWIAGPLAATHGSPNAYDTRVPVVLYGAGIAPGEYLDPVTPADIAPTLAFLSGVTLPHPDGRVLTEALER